MKKNSKIAMLVLLLMCMFSTASAQYKFVVDALRGDETNLYNYDPKWSDSWVHLGEAVGTLPNGTEVIIAQSDTVVKNAYFPSIRKDKEYEDDVIAVTYNGSQYLVCSRDLMLSPNDTSGKTDFINKKQSKHEGWAPWYYTYTPYILIFILLALATVFAATSHGGPFSALMVPLLLLAAIVIEVFGVYCLGTDMLWWVDKDQFPMGKVLLRLALFAVAIVMQIFSIRLYQNAMGDGARGELNVRRPIVWAIIGAGLMLGCIIFSLLFRKSFDPTQMFYVGAAMWGISIVIGIISAAVQNIRAIGFLGGLAFTIFAIIYGVGFIVALTMLIIGIVNAFMEMIVTIGGGVLVLFIMSHFIPTRTYTENGVTYEVYEH